uniref:Uncharacterized protein n=1 Tax=Anguilla anguilla TaxID=7936 RepID=A0A0E9TIY4_ANGAN
MLSSSIALAEKQAKVRRNEQAGTSPFVPSPSPVQRNSVYNPSVKLLITVISRSVQGVNKR